MCSLFTQRSCLLDTTFVELWDPFHFSCKCPLDYCALIHLYSEELSVNKQAVFNWCLGSIQFLIPKFVEIRTAVVAVDQEEQGYGCS